MDFERLLLESAFETDCCVLFVFTFEFDAKRGRLKALCFVGVDLTSFDKRFIVDCILSFTGDPDRSGVALVGIDLDS